MATTQSTGTLYIISAASGTGKTSLVAALLEQMERVLVSVSYTTRPVRPGEKEGVNYHFVSREEFSALLAEDDFLEHAEVFGNNYGTSHDWVKQKLTSGYDVILEIDWQGAQQIQKILPMSVSIFILPPSIDALRSRLHVRGQDDSAVIEQRLSGAREEISHCDTYDYVIVNDKFDQALADLKVIVGAGHLRRPAQKVSLSRLLPSLLEI